MALDGPRKSDSTQAKNTKELHAPSIIVAAEIRHSESFQALNKLTETEQGSIVVDSKTAAHPEFKVVERQGLSLNAALEYTPQNQPLPPITSYHTAASNLGLHKAVLARQIQNLAAYIPALKNDPSYANALPEINSITPRKDGLMNTWLNCKRIRENLESWVRKHQRSIVPEQIQPLSFLITTILNQVAWIEAASASPDFYNESRDTVLLSFTESFYKLVEEIQKPVKFKKTSFKLQATELITRPLSIKFNFSFFTAQQVEVRYVAVAKLVNNTFIITALENLNANKLDSDIKTSLLGKSTPLESVDINREYLTQAGLLQPLTKQTPATPKPVELIPEVVTKPVISESKAPNWWKKTTSAVTQFVTSLFPKAQNTSSNSSLKRPAFWRTAALAGVMGLLGLSGREKSANTDTTPAVLAQTRAVSTPSPIQTAVETTQANISETNSLRASATVHAGLNEQAFKQASIQRGLDMALQTSAGQDLVRNLYPGADLDRGQLQYLANNIAHRIRRQLPALHTHTNREIISIRDAGVSDNGHLFEVYLNEGESTYVQTPLPTLTTVAHHSLAAQRAVTQVNRVIPPAPANNTNSPESELGTQAHSQPTPSFVTAALDQLITADQHKQHEYLRAQETADRNARRKHLRQYFDKLHATAAERRKLQK